MLETELIIRLKKKEVAAVRDIVSQYNRRLFSMVYRFIRQKEDAEDILQEAWIKFFNSLDKFKGESKIYTYLYRIAMNEALTYLRRNRVKRLFFRDHIEKPDYNSPEAIYLSNEKMTVIEEAVKTLPSRQKQVFLLRKSEELSFKEVAEVMKITENNAKVLFFHALQKIRKNLKERGAL
ncbi:MAG: sigma-70 family RNA polymerase sigma factor [bacterium]|nr:sigma-70 family RNA polymerase sigma factor [bacterium]